MMVSPERSGGVITQAAGAAETVAMVSPKKGQNAIILKPDAAEVGCIQLF